MKKFDTYMYNGVGFLKVPDEYCVLDVQDIDYLIEELQGLKEKLGVFGTETSGPKGLKE